MTFRNVVLEVDHHVAWLTLNNPDRLNAMTMALLRDLRDAVLAVQADTGVRCLVLQGAGRAFSAGGDLAGFKHDIDEGDQESFLARLRFAQAVFDLIDGLKLPVIAAVNGYAIAGGLELLLCCDVVFAAESARIGDGHIKYGVIPGGGSSVRLPRKVPPNIANQMLLSGEIYPADQLREWGLVNAVFEDERLRDEVAEFASQLARRSPFAMCLIKKVVTENRTRSVAEGLSAELDTFALYARHPDFEEGLRAFSEKRLPDY
ncbi:enoyl-CoA hydratase/isomerase family protein [Marinobacter sp. M1N3S26]|uniref:enoyl-CoA hydratase/isomerase family protein n=1 Tax=unclassified Marinobacter TaxID=83889 RepID=UPI00387AA59B